MDLDLGKKIGVWKFWGGVLGKVRFGLREKNWSLEILGEGVFWERSDLDLGKKIGVWKFFLGRGVLKVKTQSAKICLNFNFGSGGCSEPNFRTGCSEEFEHKFCLSTFW